MIPISPKAEYPPAEEDLSRNSRDDAQVTLGRVTEHAQRLLVGGTVVRGSCLLDAVEFDDHQPLRHAMLVNLRRHAPRQEAASRCLHRWSCQLRIRHQRLLVTN